MLSHALKHAHAVASLQQGACCNCTGCKALDKRYDSDHASFAEYAIVDQVISAMASHFKLWLESLHQRLAALFLTLVEKDYIPDIVLRCGGGAHGTPADPAPCPVYSLVLSNARRSQLTIMCPRPGGRAVT